LFAGLLLLLQLTSLSLAFREGLTYIMVLQFSISQWAALIALLCAGLANAHTVITYPGYRGNNLHTNGTVEESNGLGQAYYNGSLIYPYGMEWMYPCMNYPAGLRVRP
jgi:hypothetical protein